MEHLFADPRGAATPLGSAVIRRLREAGAALDAAWRYAAARRRFNRLDAATMRDLGMSASEFGSYWAESEGLAEHTRLRVHVGGRPPGAAV